MTLYVLLMYDCEDVIIIGIYDSYEKAVEEKNKRPKSTRKSLAYNIEQYTLNKTQIYPFN